MNLPITKQVNTMGYLSDVGAHCKRYRSQVLEMTLDDMSRATGVNVGTLSAFEHGRSTNINHVFRYCEIVDDERRVSFIDGLMKLFNQGGNNE